MKKNNKEFYNEDFRFNVDDFFLVSYPRSGNTWVRYLLANILFPDRKWDITNLNLAVPDIHQKIPDNYLNKKPRIFKSHFVSYPDYNKVIYLCRDGRDVAISFYDLKTKLRNYNKDFGCFLDEFLNGSLNFGSWEMHVASWIKKNKGVDVLFIKYEDLFENTNKLLHKLLEFIKFDTDNSNIDRAIMNSSFVKQQSDMKNYKFKTHWEKGFSGGVKGAPGKWFEVFDNSLNKKFLSSEAGKILVELGYNVDPS